MQGEEEGSQTEEEEGLTSQEEVEEAVEVEVGREEELLAGTMMMMISALILDRLVPAGNKAQLRNLLLSYLI